MPGTEMKRGCTGGGGGGAGGEVGGLQSATEERKELRERSHAAVVCGRRVGARAFTWAGRSFGMSSAKRKAELCTAAAIPEE